MPSFRTTFAASAAILASVVSADYIINPESVSGANRAQWCQTQLASCPIICGQVADGSTSVNTCDPDVLTYGCICGNGLAPNVSEYTLTLPYFTCVEWGNQCVTACLGDNTCAQSCREDNPCGAQNPTPLNETATEDEDETSETTPTPSSSADEVHDGLGGEDTEDDSDTTTTPESTAVTIGRSYGLAILSGSMFAVFALL